MNDFMRIGELSERAGVTPRTVRYYESLGLISPGSREGNGQHYYTEETLSHLRKIDQLKNLGLSLEEIRDVSVIYFGDANVIKSKRRVLEILRQHLAETNQKIDSLQEFRTDLLANIEHFERWLETHPD